MIRALLSIAALLLVLIVPAVAAADSLPPVIQRTMPERLIIPSIGVDAPVTELGIDPYGDMESPDDPYTAAWYSFSPTPGNPGNAVFSGHRDWRTGVTGVFWRLGYLEEGDTITVLLEDGTELTYGVLLSVLLYPGDMPIEEIVGQTPDEMLTLITCAGTFDPLRREYDMRRVVWAGRIS